MEKTDSLSVSVTNVLCFFIPKSTLLVLFSLPRAPHLPDAGVVETLKIAPPQYFLSQPPLFLNRAARMEDIQCLTKWRENFGHQSRFSHS